MGRLRYRVRGPRHGHPYRRSHAPARPMPPRPGPAPHPAPSTAPILGWDGLRRVRPLPLAALILRWLAIAVLCLAVLDIARVAGVPILLFVLAWTGASFMRRRHRLLHGEPHYRGVPARGERAPSSAPPEDGSEGGPETVRGEPRSQSRGNPYDLDTYLRRLGEHGP